MATLRTSPGDRRERRVPQSPCGEGVDRFLRDALAEDVGGGDLTTEAVVPAAARSRGQLIAKESGVVAGIGIFARVFELLDPKLVRRRLLADGESVAAGAIIAELEAASRALLTGERTALNLVQRLSGIATRTRRFVERARGVRILDTRKTTPALRRFEKYAVLCGGGENHRMGLFDEIMLKNNHLDVTARPLSELLRVVRERHGQEMRITAEARNEREALEAVRGGADVVLLDNLTPEELARMVPLLRRSAADRARPLEIEASGGVDLENVAEIAASGVDRISVGALTHSAPALDLAFRLEPLS